MNNEKLNEPIDSGADFASLGELSFDSGAAEQEKCRFELVHSVLEKIGDNKNVNRAIKNVITAVVVGVLAGGAMFGANKAYESYAHSELIHNTSE